MIFSHTYIHILANTDNFKTIWLLLGDGINSAAGAIFRLWEGKGGHLTVVGVFHMIERTLGYPQT